MNFLSLIALFLIISSPAYAVDKCEDLAPTNAQTIDEDFKGKADGEVKGLLGKIAGGAASIDGEYKKLVSDELQHYPEANKLYVWQRIIYLACISPDMKININELFLLYLNGPPMTPAKPTERDIAQKLMNSFCNRGVLQNDYSWEIPSQVYGSIEKIRNELSDAIQQIPIDSLARQPLQRMQIASRLVLQNPAAFPNGPGGLPRPISGKLRDAIHDFRSVFATNASQLVDQYALVGNCNLSQGLDPSPMNSSRSEPKN